jgi:hypothetical protein
MLLVLDRRGTPEQRAALFHILGGEDTEPSATIFQIFSLTRAGAGLPLIG